MNIEDWEAEAGYIESHFQARDFSQFNGDMAVFFRYVEMQHNAARRECVEQPDITDRIAEIRVACRVEMLRVELQSFAEWNDPNGEYEDCTPYQLADIVAAMLLE